MAMDNKVTNTFTKNTEPLFFGESGLCSQSTPKPTYSLKESKRISRTGTEHDISGDNTLPFVDLDHSHEKLSASEDSGTNMSIFSEREESTQSSLLPSENESMLPFGYNSRIEEIGRRAQSLVERINQSRAMDQEVMTCFENQLVNKVSEVCQQVKEQMFSSYAEHGREMESSLQDLSEVLERSSQLSTELQGASHTLTAINMGLQLTPGP